MFYELDPFADEDYVSGVAQAQVEFLILAVKMGGRQGEAAEKMLMRFAEHFDRLIVRYMDDRHSDGPGVSVN